MKGLSLSPSLSLNLCSAFPSFVWLFFPLYFTLSEILKTSFFFPPRDFLRVVKKVVFVFLKMIFTKLLFKIFYVCLILEKVVNKKYFLVKEKYFPVKEKFGLVFKKVFSFYFGRKTLSGNCEKFRKVILFVDYIKFDPQTFDLYIYIVLNICFSISFLIIYFYINFNLHFYNCYLIFPYYFLIKVFYLSNLILIIIIVTYFI